MGELAKRIRAARGYAGLSQKQLAEVLEVDEQTVKRTEAGKRTPKRPDLLAIAHECELPLSFFDIDFGRLEQLKPSLEERIATIERGLGLHYARLDEALTELGGLAEPPGGQPPGPGDTPQPGETPDEDDQAPPGETRSAE